MGRIRTKSRGPMGKSRHRRIQSHVTVWRHENMSRSEHAFDVCINVGRMVPSVRHALGGSAAVACGSGRNPRAALAKAASSLAGKLRKRSGAFRGA